MTFHEKSLFFIKKYPSLIKNVIPGGPLKELKDYHFWYGNFPETFWGNSREQLLNWPLGLCTSYYFG